MVFKKQSSTDRVATSNPNPEPRTTRAPPPLLHSTSPAPSQAPGRMARCLGGQVPAGSCQAKSRLGQKQ